MIASIDTKRLEEFGRSMATIFKASLATAVEPLTAKIGQLETRLAYFESAEFPAALEASLSKHTLEVAGIKLALESLPKELDKQLEPFETALSLTAGRIEAHDKKLAALEEIGIGGRLDLLVGMINGVREIVETTGVDLEKQVEASASAIAKLEAREKTQETLNMALEASLIELVKATVASSVAEIETIKGDKGDTGASVVSAIINREGSLILTCADGTLRDVGQVVGKDGAAGLGFDDLDVELVGERTLSFVWTRGDMKKEREFVIPWILDKGVFVEGQKYKSGDGVTFGGALWIAQKDTGSKPGHDDTWRLAVKKGRDGRDLRKDEGAHK